MEKAEVKPEPRRDLPVLTLIVSGLTVSEAEEMMCLVQEIYDRDPTRTLGCLVQGLGSICKTREEADQTLRRIIPKKGVAA